MRKKTTTTGQLRISRVQGGDLGGASELGSFMRVQILDMNGTAFVELETTLEMFMAALTGQLLTDARVNVCEPELFGLSRERRDVLVPLPSKLGREEAEDWLRQNYTPPDGWRAVISLGSQYSINMNNEARFSIERFVKKGT